MSCFQGISEHTYCHGRPEEADVTGETALVWLFFSLTRSEKAVWHRVRRQQGRQVLRSQSLNVFVSSHHQLNRAVAQSFKTQNRSRSISDFHL